MADDILERYANLRLDDEDGGVVDLGTVNSMPSKDKFHLLLIGRIKNLPFNCRSDDDVKEIVANWGEVIEVDEDILGLDRFRRVKVLLNVTKPLRRFQRIIDKGGRVVCVEFAYERLPFFCFACRVIGHAEKECEMVSEESKKVKLW
ncbi:uncharacterized protein LOC110732082 [Chenopodium quinoa]|uniref:uncharacterized protein LOC110732082 n=1 Tax=Chenopodium quinoa TaxID=63459 RepID=UPI000B76CDAD|nr:uncharacterized protein LOC110732082 [Chenopodium quinoa]